MTEQPLTDEAPSASDSKKQFQDLGRHAVTAIGAAFGGFALAVKLMQYGDLVREIMAQINAWIPGGVSAILLWSFRNGWTSNSRGSIIQTAKKLRGVEGVVLADKAEADKDPSRKIIAAEDLPRLAEQIAASAASDIVSEAAATDAKGSRS